jgi:hypothetical protein
MVSALYITEIVLSHSIVKAQHTLIDQREVADSGSYYQEGWQKLAVEVWKASPQDPTLLEYLKSEGVGIHQGPPPASDQGNATNAAPAAAPSTNAPAASAKP